MDSYDFPGEMFVEDDGYLDIAAELVRLYNWIYSFRTLRRDYPEDTVKAFEFIRNADPKVFDSQLKEINFGKYELLKRDGRYSSEHRPCCGYIVEVKMRQYLRLDSNDSDEDSGIVRDGNGFITDIKEADAETKAEALDIYRRAVIASMEDMCSGVYYHFSEVTRIHLGTDGEKKPLLGVYYHTLIQALFATMDLYLSSGVEYRECKHSKCHVYFTPDTVHPQDRCEEHMRIYRTKRQNAKEKAAAQKAEESKET